MFFIRLIRKFVVSYSVNLRDKNYGKKTNNFINRVGN